MRVMRTDTHGLYLYKMPHPGLRCSSHFLMKCDRSRKGSSPRESAIRVCYLGRVEHNKNIVESGLWEEKTDMGTVTARLLGSGDVKGLGVREGLVNEPCRAMNTQTFPSS